MAFVSKMGIPEPPPHHFIHFKLPEDVRMAASTAKNNSWDEIRNRSIENIMKELDYIKDRWKRNCH